MKNLLVVIIVIAITSVSGCAQNKKAVPDQVKTAFAQKFPDASNVKWDKENDAEWEAEFKMSGKEYSANFNLEGIWLETEFEISSNEIPDLVKAAIEKEFSGYKIEESEMSETAEGKCYEFELKMGKTEVETAINSKGELIKKESIKEKVDDGD
ncbi:PepSY-like domain-containing protein [Labilibaculum sp. K2S]|uniref:PepSY-like domain-containing protein n=1 Tax=Labilibaculum sp. K2S TaxID=3056386 RepID=UPI0025A42FCD|nr:PepSY-like domain-containing protein [Labilibaculum sp. K2S]MDM8160075.1 PepSY-like domain-containing protein [Labilibaculum sp. K2S]